MSDSHKAANDFVAAYNKQDAAAIASLFTEDGEMADIIGTDLTSKLHFTLVGAPDGEPGLEFVKK